MDPDKDVPFWCSARVQLALIAFFGFILMYAQRVGMSIAIVCMVNQTALTENNDYAINTSSINISEGVYYINENNTEEQSCSHSTTSGGEGFLDGPFTWEKDLQGHILGSFYYGYLVSQIPSAMIAERLGGKWVMTGFTALSTAATLLSPVAAKFNPIALIILRVLAGIGSGAIFPVMLAIWSKWAPPNERTKLTNITFAGAWMGNILAMPIAGLLCRYGFGGGWPSIFYTIGLATVVWHIVWTLTVYDTPDKHPRISDAEKDYIFSALGTHQEMRKDPVKWGSIFCSPAVWAILMAGISADWGLYTFLSNMPTYMHEVLKFDIQSNGFFSALPFIGLFLNMNISPIIADKLISKELLSVKNTRKLMFAVGSVGAGLFLVGLSFVDCQHPALAVALLVAGVTISGSCYSGYIVNPVDIAPKFAGTILGIANGFASVTGFITPYVVAVLTPNRNQVEWQRVFFVSAAIYVLGAIIFSIFGEGEVQKWAEESPPTEEEIKLHHLNPQGKISNKDGFGEDPLLDSSRKELNGNNPVA